MSKQGFKRMLLERASLAFTKSFRDYHLPMPDCHDELAHFVYCDISTMKGKTRGAFVVDQGRPQIRLLPDGLIGHGAELALIKIIICELPQSRECYIICNDTTSLQFLRCGNGIKQRGLSREVEQLKAMLTDRNVMLLFLQQKKSKRPKRYTECHDASRKAANLWRLSSPCPTCGSGTGEPCVNGRKQPSAPHPKRLIEPKLTTAPWHLD